MKKNFLLFLSIALAVSFLQAQNEQVLSDFEDGSIDPWQDWNGAGLSIAANPDSSEANPSDSVALFDQTTGAWDGFARWDDTPLITGQTTAIALDVYVPDSATSIKLQLDNSVSAGANFEAFNDVPADTWTHIVFDITGSAGDYHQIAFQSGLADSIYFDNITLLSGGEPPSDTTGADTVMHISNVLVGSVDDSTDFSATLTMTYDADSIYMTFDVTDDSIVNEGASYQVDNIEIYFDMDNSKNVHYPRNGPWVQSIDAAFDSNDYQLRLVPGVDYSVNNTGRPGGPSIEGGVNQMYTETDSGYQFVLNIAWDSLMVGFEPDDSTLIGFDVLISDNDATASDANRNQIALNSPTDKIFNDPSLWATLRLQGGYFKMVPDKEPPTTPENLAASVTDGDITLTWDPSTDNTGVMSYVIYEGASVLDTMLAMETGNSFTINDRAEGTYTFSVKAVDNYGMESDESESVEAVVEGGGQSGIEEEYAGKLEIYPVPAGDVIYINNPGGIQSIEIFDLNGKMVKTVNDNRTVISVDISDLTGGIYVIRANTDKGVYTGRIVK